MIDKSAIVARPRFNRLAQLISKSAETLLAEAE